MMHVHEDSETLDWFSWERLHFDLPILPPLVHSCSFIPGLATIEANEMDPQIVVGLRVTRV